VEGTFFPKLIEQTNDLPGKRENLPLYYVECNKGYCGWKIEDFERIDETGEKITAFFVNKTTPDAEILAADTILIHKGSMSAPRSIYQLIDSTHRFWFYPVGWKTTEDVVDNYTPNGLGILVNALGFLILYIDVAIALFSLPLTVILIKRAGKRENLQEIATGQKQ